VTEQPEAERPPATTKEKPVKPEPPKAQAQSPILGAIDRMRETARWVIGAFGAIAVVLVGTSQLSDLGDSEGGRLALAIAGAVIALVAIAASIFSAAKVFAPEEASLDELTDTSEVGRRAAADPGLLFGEANSVSELVTAYKESLHTYGEDRRIAQAAGATNEQKQKAAASGRRYFALQPPVEHLRQLSLYYAIRSNYREAMGRIAVLLVFGGVGLLMFAYGANPPSEPDSPSQAGSFSLPASVTIAPAAGAEDELSEILGEECSSGAILAILLSTADERVEFVTRPTATCATQRVSVSADLVAYAPTRPAADPGE
jgi:hypothetical protein